MFIIRDKNGEIRMKYVIALLSLAGLLLVGCEYESPLTKDHNLAIDSALLGLWEEIPDEGGNSEPDDRMMILKYSDTEYLIHYPTGDDGIYYRGYPIKIGGISCVQLQAIGTEDGPPETDEKDLFHVASYRLTNSGLEIKLLDTDLVDDALKTTDELVRAFLEQKDNKELFTDPGLFRRVKE